MSVDVPSPVAPGVVTTIREPADGPPFSYEVYEPTVPQAERGTLEELRDHFADARTEPPRTREATADRFAEGLPRPGIVDTGARSGSMVPDEEADEETSDAAQVPTLVQEFAAELMAGDELRYEFDDAVVDVPSRFDRPSPTATWRFDGTLTVRVGRVEE